MAPSVIPCTPSGAVPLLLLTSLLLQLDLSFENGFGGPGHQHRRALLTRPLDREAAAAGLDVDRAVEQAEPDADRDRGARAGAAGKRFAGAALPDAQPHGVSRDDLHVAGVDAARKAHVALD